MKQALAGLGVAVVLTAGFAPAQGQGPKPAGGVSLSDLSWPEAESVLTPSSVVIIPLGVATVQHGPHLKLNNNDRLARYLASRVQAASPVVIAPALTYHFYPTFLEYPGSTSVSQNTSRDMTVDIVRSFARYGPRRFYILNTGVTTMFPLAAAAQTLAEYGILLGYTGRGKIGFMFAADGDMRHPDGTIERSPDVIRQNRQELFRKKEYRGSVHPVQLNDIRCLGGGIAVADG
ncbi:MAG TPA: creatininase family protein, partial [Vicinamibacterales bacterium]